MRIKITSDSTCDLSAELLQQYNISTHPLWVIKDGESFQDGVDITPDIVFKHVVSGGDLCSTSAISIGQYQEFFAKFASEYDAVIHINIGSGFSTCFQSATIAAQDFDNVRVIDSKNLTTGQGHLVLEACRLAQEEEDLDEICRKLQEYAEKIECSFMLNRLDYMTKGGRCSAVAAFGANLLNLKPCIEVKNGKLQVVKKYRGTFEKSLASYVKDRLADRDDLILSRLFLTYTAVDSKTLDSVKKAINTYCKFDQVNETTAGCTVSCHCGPDTLGLVFVRK